jgi:hypothetical protein
MMNFKKLLGQLDLFACGQSVCQKRTEWGFYPGHHMAPGGIRLCPTRFSGLSVALKLAPFMLYL